MDKSKLRQVLIDQQEGFFKPPSDMVERQIDLAYYLKGLETVVISGIRRCGKSTLLRMIADRIGSPKLFINFDDVRLVDFVPDNYEDIISISVELFGDKSAGTTYFFDEIQNAPFWPRWINNLYGRKYKIFLTGSNASLLSSEISTFITGRQKTLKLTPFSFPEYLRLKKINFPENRLTTEQKAILYSAFIRYLENGGFPLVIKNDDLLLSKQYFEDILYRDIIARYRIKEVKEIKDLALYLFSNVGSIYSYSTLKNVTSIKSLSTIKNHIDHLCDSFVLYNLGRFCYSITKQKVSSSKIYSQDNSFLKTVAFNFSENAGKRLENLVCVELLRHNRDIYYHKEKKECDFVIKEGTKIVEAIQVCQDMSDLKTRKREMEGLIEAMILYNLKKGLILTLEEEGEEVVRGDGKKYIIKITSVWKWLME